MVIDANYTALVRIVKSDFNMTLTEAIGLIEKVKQSIGKQPELEDIHRYKRSTQQQEPTTKSERSSTYTKGPWKYMEIPGADFSAIFGNGVTVCGIPNPIHGSPLFNHETDTWDDQYQHDLETTRANARLITAAPVLIDELKNSNSNLRNILKNYAYALGIGDTEALETAIRHNEAVISKIEG